MDKRDSNGGLPRDSRAQDKHFHQWTPEVFSRWQSSAKLGMESYGKPGSMGHGKPMLPSSKMPLNAHATSSLLLASMGNIALCRVCGSKGHTEGDPKCQFTSRHGLKTASDDSPGSSSASASTSEMCMRCGTRGHRTNNCSCEIERPTSSSTTDDDDLNAPKCSDCGKKGHTAYSCLLKSEKNAGPTTRTFEAVGSPEYLAHVANKRQKLEERSQDPMWVPMNVESNQLGRCMSCASLAHKTSNCPWNNLPEEY